ncbi:hypothetical protein ACFYS8_14855 [Kitasatospora sp. NPDC004615]|uniref:hypothetical protein n=1 Tax=Kitasatospora sp. NPDC004615 TaxID=3364017 RepID=UPI0036BFE331
MKTRLLGTALVAALLFGPLVTGCSAFRDDKPVVALDAARSTIDTLLDGATKAITPAVGYDDDFYTPKVHSDWAHQSDGKAGLSKRRVLNPRIADGKADTLLGQLMDHWKAQGYTVTRDDTARRVGATMPDGARIFVTIEPHGNTHLDATVDPVKDPGTFTLFNDEQTPRPSSAATPAGRQDDPYWSH